MSDSSSTINKDASILLLPLTLNVLNQSLSLLKALTFFLITKITGSFKEFKDNPKLEACLALKSEVLDVNDTALRLLSYFPTPTSTLTFCLIIALLSIPVKASSIRC